MNSNLRDLGLVNILTEAVIKQGDTLYKTNCFSPIMAITQKIGHKQIIGAKVLIDRAAKIIATTDRVVKRLDFENPERTLFVKNLINSTFNKSG